MSNTNNAGGSKDIPDNFPAEDLVLKSSMQFFGEQLDRSDLVPLLLTTLMSGTMDQKDRILTANRLITESGTLPRPDLVKMQAVLYTFANKFLSNDDLDKVKEVMFMTRLGQMLVNDGIEKGALALISVCREIGLSYDDTRRKLIEKLELDAPAAKRYMEEFWTRSSL